MTPPPWRIETRLCYRKVTFQRGATQAPEVRLDIEITLHVNGVPAALVVDDGAPLLHVLRNQMGLRASRFGCGWSSAGACMVLMDGTPT